MGDATIAVLGLGEAGSRIAADLAGAGAEVHAYDPAAPSSSAGVVRADDAVTAVAGCSVVLALTTASAARETAAAALPGLRTGAVYADLNTAAPALKRELAALVSDAGARFADVALLGPVPLRGLGTPAVASGDGARAFADALAPLGMPVEVVSNEPGEAAARKLLRSVFMKGLAAAALESLAAAEACGQRAWVEEEIAAVVGRPLLDRLVEGSHAHAARRVEEMSAARELLLELGVEPAVVSSSASVLAALATPEAR
jgi:3-hydroxyisobutyrate dehydrogenase-like beta-hydroxyacid dehydrogenase